MLRLTQARENTQAVSQTFTGHHCVEVKQHYKNNSIYSKLTHHHF